MSQTERAEFSAARGKFIRYLIATHRMTSGDQISQAALTSLSQANQILDNSVPTWARYFDALDQKGIFSEFITDRQKTVAQVTRNLLAAGESCIQEKGLSQQPNGYNLAYRLYGNHPLSHGLQRAAGCGQTFGEYNIKTILAKGQRPVNIDPNLIIQLDLHPMTLIDRFTPSDEKLKATFTGRIIEYLAKKMGYLPSFEAVDLQRIQQAWQKAYSNLPSPTAQPKRFRLPQSVDSTAMDLLVAYNFTGQFFYAQGIEINFA